MEDYTRIDAVLGEIESLQSEVTYEILKVMSLELTAASSCSIQSNTLCI